MFFLMFLLLQYILYSEGMKRNVLILFADDAGFETPVYGNTQCKTPHLTELAKRSVTFTNAYTSVSSCSPSRSTILTGLPQHQNGMYGLHHSLHHFNSFDNVYSLPRILNDSSKYYTGIIGKKHVGPDLVYPFHFSYTEDNYPINQIGRNITLIKQLANKFLSEVNDRSFFLYIGFHDPHRCGSTNPEYGAFCEKFGDGSVNNKTIPDWKPVYYNPKDVLVPYFIPDTDIARQDIAAQYRTISRLDQGVGLLVEVLEDWGYINNTLIIYTSDNGIPFPNGRTNLYDSGMSEPMIISSPYATKRWGEQSNAMVSLTDIVPTILEWFGEQYPEYKLFGPNHVVLQGHSLISILDEEPIGWDTVYASHNLHEVTMYYPMRVLRNKKYKLIHNLNYKMPFMIDQDFFVSPTYQEILHRSISGQNTMWFKTLDEYYYREEWEMFDVINDPKELVNLVYNTSYHTIFDDLQKQLFRWQNATDDPWRCAPWGVYEFQGKYPRTGVCLSLHNGEL